MAMRRMCGAWTALLRPLLSFVLSILLVVEGSSLLPAYAAQAMSTQVDTEQRTREPDDCPTGTKPVLTEVGNDEGATGAAANPAGEDSPEAQEAPVHGQAPSSESEPSFGKGSLSKDFVAADGSAYTVTVTFDEDACVPGDAELVVGVPSEEDLQASADAANRALELADGDRVLQQQFLDVSLVAGGNEVVPAGDLDVTIKTDAIAASRSQTAEVVLVAREPVAEDERPATEEPRVADALDSKASAEAKACGGDAIESVEEAGDSSDDEAALSQVATCDDVVPGSATTLGTGTLLSTTNNSAHTDDRCTSLSFGASSLGIVVLSSVVSQAAQWQEAGMDVRLLGPRHNAAIRIDDATEPRLEAGITALRCVRVVADPSPDYGTTLWLEATPADGLGRSQLADKSALQPANESESIMVVDERNQTAEAEELGGAFAYAVRNNKLARQLFGPQGTTEPVAFRADKDNVVLAWDSGYRKVTLNMRNVSIEGMAPQDTEGTAKSVVKRIGDPASLVYDAEHVDAMLQEQVGAGECELTTLAAYDITLESQGQEYEPDDDHPLMVTIANEGISADKQLMVWHILDDGTVETVDDFVVANGTIRFEAAGFSTYAVTELRATSTVPLSTNFTLKCIAKGYARSSVVTFVDEHFNPIMGTVTGTLTRSYTGVADSRNETNWIDLYSFADSLDPAIADEYDFSRVFLTLDKANTVQKDFRHIQVGDERNILPNGSTSLYRAYFHMTDISENAPGQAYHGTWYLLSNGGAMDNIFIEFYHVAPASFYALDTRGDPVAGAEFTLYSDHACTTPYEYKHEVVTATSNRRGLVSFGKIPRGTYYMKETLIPDGYKKTTKVRTVVVDGQTAIPNVIHEDDDGSVIVSEAKSLVFTKQWDESSGQDHAGYSVVVTVSLDDEVVEELTLNEQNHWTQTLDDLDPNQSYVITEKSVLNAQGTDVTQDWIPHIETEIESEEIEYKQADAFIKGKDYVMVAAGYALSGAGKPLAGDGTSLTPQAVTVSDDEIVSDVTDEMLWNVYGLTNDGVITLQNLGTHKYLDQNDSSALRWYQNPELPQFVRHVNTNGIIKIYFRRNLNNTSTIWLWMRGRVDRTQNANDVALFTIYRKLNTKTYDITITNKPTTYPIKMRSVSYPDAEPLPNVRYDLYTEAAFDQGDAEPLKEALVANEQGFLADDGSDTVSLSAGTYYMVRSSNDEGYAPEDPVKFTITRKGALRVKQADRAIPDFAYVSDLEEGNVSYPLLQLPSYKPATVKLTLEVEGQYADRTRQFGFSLGIPSGMDELEAIVNGVPTTLSQEEGTEFTLAHGQSVVLQNVPAALDYVITQTSARVAAVPQNNDALYHASVSVVATPGSQSSVLAQTSPEDARTITLANILGTADDPARVVVVNSLANADVPPTGLEDDVEVWHSIVMVCLCVLLAMWLHGRRAHVGKARSFGRD